MKLSVVIPAHNEEHNLRDCVVELRDALRDRQRIPYEIIVVDDCSGDGTVEAVGELRSGDPNIRLVRRQPPPGFGRALRAGLDAVTGDVVVIYMADRSDHPEDVVAYYRKIQEGYDCVYGSRFIRGGRVENYPRLKLVVNRMVNHCIQWMFWTKFNDLTNAFKAYRTDVVRTCGPYNASHFNITLEMSLSALARRYHIAQIPISWSGRTWGSSSLRLREMGRRYLSTLMMVFFQRMLISDDLLAERLARRRDESPTGGDLESRLRRLEARLGTGDMNESMPASAEGPAASPAGDDGAAPPLPAIRPVIHR